MTCEFKVDNTIIKDDSECFVIAEIGNNHQGNIQKCLDIILAAKNSGASAVKLQKRNNQELFTNEFYNSNYDNVNSFGKTYGKHREFLEFGEDEYKEIIDFCKSIGIIFFCTPFDFSSLEFLEKIDLKLYKIASADIDNLELIRETARTKKPIIISTGGSSYTEIESAINEICKFHKNFSILQCTSQYPAEFENLNLNVITELKKRYPENIIGYSGHDNGISMAIAAYVLGARIIEKHFTLNRTWKGTDQVFSLTPEGMRKMIRDLKRTKQAFGSSEKKLLDCEKQYLYKLKKSIKVIDNISKGTVIKRQHLCFKCPGDGVSPSKVEYFIGKKVLRDIDKDHAIKYNDVEV